MVFQQQESNVKDTSNEGWLVGLLGACVKQKLFGKSALMQSFCSRINVHMPLWPLKGPGLNG